MPRDLTHVIMADDIRETLDADTVKMLKKNAEAYHMGSIIHDSFLYGLKPEYSQRMHGGKGEDPRKIVFSMMDDIRNEKDPEIADKKKALTFGFLSHMAADTCFHPFVYSASGSQVKENNENKQGAVMAMAKHRLIETMLDVHYINKKGYDFDNFRPLRKINKNVKDKKLLTDFFAKSFEKAYDIDGGVKTHFRVGFTTQLFLGRVTRNQQLAKTIERMDRVLGGNLKSVLAGFYKKDEKAPEKLTDFSFFKHPVTNEPVETTLADIEKKSIERGNLFITKAQEYIKTGDKETFKNAVPAYNLDTGIPSTGLEDIKHAEPLSFNDLRGKLAKKFGELSNIKFLPSGADACIHAIKDLGHPGIKKFLGDGQLIKTVPYQEKKEPATAVTLKAISAKKQR